MIRTLPLNYNCSTVCSLLILLAICSGCEVEESVNIRLTMEERSQLDSRIIAHMDSLRPILEEMCTNTREDRIAIAVDSIVQRRLEEEARMRARLPQNLRD